MSKDGYGDGNSYRGVICKDSEIKTFFFDDKDEDKKRAHLDINDLVPGHPEAEKELEKSQNKITNKDMDNAVNEILNEAIKKPAK